MFSAVILALVGLAFQVARHSTRASNAALQMASQITGTDRATTVPYDSLAQLLTPDTVVSGVIRVVITYVVDSLSTTRKDVYVITQTSVPGTWPDTIRIQRGRVRYPIPLK